MGWPRRARSSVPAAQRRARLSTGYAEVRATPGITTHMLQADGANHERARCLVGAGLTKRRIDLLAASIQRTTDDLLAEVASAGRDGSPVDLIVAFAYPLPMTVICELMGVPDRLRPGLPQGTEAMANGVADPAHTDRSRREPRGSLPRGLRSRHSSLHARRWPGWRPGSLSRRCCDASRGYGRPDRWRPCPGSPASCFTAWSDCRFR